MPFPVAYQFDKRIWYKQQRLIPQQTISDTGSASEVIDTLSYMRWSRDLFMLLPLLLAIAIAQLLNYFNLIWYF